MAGEAYDQAEERRAADRERKLARNRRFVERLQGEGLLLVLAVVVIIMWVSSPYFLTQANLLTAASVVSILGIMAVLETLIVIAGEIDISIGSVMAVTSAIIGLLVTEGFNIWLATVIGLLCSGAIGALNGVITVFFKVNSLVTTLGTYSIFLGIAYVISNTMTVSIAGEGFSKLGSGYIASVPVPVFFFLGISADRFLRGPVHRPGPPHLRHRGQLRGRRPLGHTTEPDPYRSVRVHFAQCRRGRHNRHLRAGAAAPQIGDPYLLSVVTAVILGGASLRGGRGTMFGTLVAVAILGVLQNGFALLQFSSFLEDTVLGCLLIFAVLTDRLVRRAER